MKYLKKFNESVDSISDDINSLLIDLIDKGFNVVTYIDERFNGNKLEVVIAKSKFIKQDRSIANLHSEIDDIITDGIEYFSLNEVYDKIEMLNDFLSSDYNFLKYSFQTDEYSGSVSSKILPDDEGYYDFIRIKYVKKI